MFGYGLSASSDRRILWGCGMDINARLDHTDVTIAEVSGQLIRLRSVAGGLSIDSSIVSGAKCQAAVALLTSALDLGAATARLIKCDPEHSWVAAHTLHRPQFEHFMRGAFFAGPASEEEALAFVGQDRMPRRADSQNKLSTITLAQLVHETSQHWGGGDAPSELWRGVRSELNSIVHGGKAVVDVYTHGSGVGANKATPEQICSSMNNSLAISCIVLETLLSLSVPSKARDAAEGELDSAKAVLARMRPLMDAVLGPRSAE